jgi:uncharacterized protein YndB with AHSA1/START domain
MNIDPNAPLVARDEIVIAAPVEKVWGLETDINRWPEWQPGVTAARLEGDLAAGSVFRWKAAGMGLVSTLQEVQPPQRVSWTGKSLGMSAVHCWTFEAQGDRTRVITEESISGWLASLLKLLMPGFLQKDMVKSLETLKAQAEKS